MAPAPAHNKTKAKAQFAMEFMIAVAVAITFLAVMSFFAYYESSFVEEQKNSFEVKKLVEEIAGLINIAAYSPGFYAEFSVPGTIGGEAVLFDATDYYFYAVWANKTFFSEIRVQQFNCACPLSEGEYFIKNVEQAVAEEVVLLEKIE